MMNTLSLIVVALSTLLLYLRRRLRQTLATPPSPPKIPIIGHLHLLTNMPHHALTQLAHRLGPIVYLKLGQVPTVVISSSQLAELVLKTHDHVFASRPQLLAAQYLSFGCSDVTFSPYGAYWRQARKICVTELLSPKRVSAFRLVRDEEVRWSISSVLTRSGSEVDLSEVLFTLANNILCRVAFGKRFIDDSKEDKKHDLVGVLKETQALLSGFCIGDFFPQWGWVNWVSGFKRRLESNLEDLRSVCDEIIKEHASKRDKEEDREDFVDVLLRVQGRDDLEVPITCDNLKALVLDMFVAGTDTTSATLEWVMTELVRHPRVMKKVQDEVRKVAGNTGKVEESHLQYLHYLKAVVKETMRLHPLVPLLVPRESMEKCDLNGYEIPAGSRVLINTYAIGRDADSWENPLDYNPERFEHNDIDFKGQDFKFLPFGGGRRGCPGFSFGLATVETTLASLLYHFDWALPHGLGADDVDMNETFGLATRKKLPLILLPTPNADYGFKAGDT